MARTPKLVFKPMFRKRKNNLARKVAKIQRSLKLAKPEVKPWDGGIAPTTIPNTGLVYSFFIPVQGVTYINREGLSCVLKSFYLNMTTVMAPAATNTHLRVIIFRGRKESGVTFTPSDILLSLTPGSLTTWLTRDKYSILMDRYYDMADSGDSSSIIIRRRFNVTKQKCRFTGNGTGIEDGGVYMMVIADEAVNLPTFSFQSRITFTG